MDPPGHEALTFRRLVYKFSLKLSKEECRALVYIRLYDCKERYRDANTLEVLSRLETDCVFSPDRPEGLIDVAKDIHRMDLKDMVQNFVKKKQRREKAGSKTAEKIVTRFRSESPVSDEHLHLKAILEVTLSQAAVFVQQVDILQQAIVAGTKEQRQKAAEAIRDAGHTAQALTERLQKAQGELEHGSHNSTSSLQSDSSGSEELNEYQNVKYGPPPPADNTVLVETPGIGAEIPIPTPRLPLQESEYKPTQIPTEKERRQTQTLTSSLNMADLSHVRQQGTPLVDHRGIVYPDTRRWTASAKSSSSKSAQSSPSQMRHSLQPKQHAKPAVLPRKMKLTSPDASLPRTSAEEQSSDDLGDYTILSPITDEGDESLKTGDSGFEEARQLIHREVFEGSEAHYYKSLQRTEAAEDGAYAELQH